MHLTPKIIQIENLEIGYSAKKGFKTVKSEINLDALKKELIAVIGTNGIGKSTLLKTIIGLLQKPKGSILIDNQPIEKYSKLELAQLISFVTTESVDINYLNVYDLVALGRFPYTNWFGNITDTDRFFIDEALNNVGMDNFRLKNVNELSDGERQRVVIARALAQDTDIILLDEPTAFLDLRNKLEIIQLLHNLTRRQQKCIIFSTHDLNVALRNADKIWLFIDNKIVQGAPEDLVISGDLLQLFKSSNLIFDSKNIDFKFDKKIYKHIEIESKTEDDLVLNSTSKMLERFSYCIVNQSENKICIDKINGKTRWKLSKSTNEIGCFDSLYSLSKNLE